MRRIFPELLRSRELLLDLVSKELRIRYRYALMGFLWAFLEPLLMTAILYFVFGIVFNFRGGATTPAMYAVSLLTGLVFWQFLSHTLGAGARSLVDNGNLVNKVLFPREVIPLSVVGVNLVNLLIGTAILLGLFLLLGGRLGAQAVWLPVLFGIELALVVGLALLLSSLNVFYRDVSYVVDVGLILAFYATPIFYDFRADVFPRLVEHPWLYYTYMMNPMVGLISSYRQVLIENQPPVLELVAIPAIQSGIALVVGAVVFRRKAGIMSDYL
ncbi:MAG: ABC transporter permease [FCB group bacterium]|nr:ABC transporter permease [FCB group bacterium]